MSDGKLSPVSLTVRLFCKRKVTEAKFSGCLSSASNVRNLSDFHMNLMHPDWCIINRGERFSLHTEEHLGIAFLFPPEDFTFFCFLLASPQVFTYITLASLLIQTPLKAHLIASSEEKTKQNSVQSYKEFLTSLTTLHCCKTPAPTCGIVFPTHLYDTRRRLGKQQCSSRCQPCH